MIVKIWPIKASYPDSSGKVGGIKGIINSVNYISDVDKCLTKEKDMDIAYLYNDDRSDYSYINKDEDFSRVISYMANDDKTQGKYISAYMCNEETVVEDFLNTQTKYKDKKIAGNVAFHLVQSFPEGLDISDEEVHQCGMELVKKIGKHQALICSHVHPVMDDEGELRGKCKHNHILINAYMMKDKIDPEHPDIIKYHDNKTSYLQLQIWNDEIALEHGFPIIRNPETERKYSWKETNEINKGLSWKEQVRNDIDWIKQKTNNWPQFVKEMNLQGYQIKDGVHTTYIAPDGRHRVRGKTLGDRFIKENILQYWKIKDEIKSEVLYQLDDKHKYTLKDIISNTNSHLHIDIPLGGNLNPKRSTFPLPLDKKILNQDAIDSYFDINTYYEIKNENNQIIDSVQGIELHDYFTEILKSENERIKQKTWWESEREKRRYQKIKEQERKEKQYYSNNKFKNTNTNQVYKISIYDKNGRLKTDLELIFTLAYIVIHAEQGRWEPREVPQEHVKDAYFGPPAWKAQNMMDSLQIAREEGLDNQFDIEARLNTTGAALSRARAAVRRNEKIKNKMESLQQAISEYEDTQYYVQKIFDLPENDYKLHELHDNKDIIEKYTNAKRIMHMHKVETQADISDFKKRYLQVEKNIEISQQLLDEKKDEYSRLKKLQYNTSLAQDVRYCYGPEYEIEHSPIDRETKEPKMN